MVPNSKSDSKDFLIDLINLLRGEEEREKLLAKIATNISHSSLEVQRRTSTRWKIILPVIFGLVIILIFTSLLYINSISHDPCTVKNVLDTTATGMGPPVDIVVSPKTDLAYAAYPGSKVILAISCHNEKIMVTPISTNGTVIKLAADPTNNKIYAVTTNNGNSVIDSNNDIDFSDITEIFGEVGNGTFGDILYDRPEFGNPQETKVIPAMVDVNTNGTLNSKTGKIYVSNNNSGIIQVKSSKGDPLKSITGLGTSRFPFSLIENPNTNKIYVINSLLQKVSVIDSKTDSLLKNIPVGRGPIDIAIDYSNNKIYVANQGSGTISVIDGNKDQVVQVIPIALGSSNNRLYSIAVDSKAHRLYLGFWHSDETGSVSIANPAEYNDNQYIQVSQSPIDIDFNTNTSKLYVAEFNNRSVAVIDTNTDTLKRDISLGESKSNNLPFNIAVNPNSNKIYVANVNPGNNDSSIVSVITGKNDSILKNVSLPFLVSDIAVDPSLNKAYVTGSYKNKSYLSVIDGQNDTVMDSKSLPFVPSDIAVNSNTSNIYLANNKDWSITVIDDKGDNKTIPLSIPPESIVVDPEINRLYVTSYSKPSSSKQQSFLDPTDITLPRLTQVQVINGLNNSIWWNNQTLKLDPRLGDMILSFNPKTHDLVATSPSTNTIQSWNINQAQDAIERSEGILSRVKLLSTGTDYAQSALTNNGSKLYIVNPAFNTIKVENVNSSIISR